MPDVREILTALSPDDQAVWNEHRTCMRKCYLEAVNATIGVHSFEQQDDSFMDLIDIRLALLFDRAGMLETTKEIGLSDGGKIESDLIRQEDIRKAASTIVPDHVPVIEPSEAVKKLAEWGELDKAARGK